MGLHSERYLEMVERMGGVNEEALGSMVYWNNPLALKHWTMNVAELLYISGAILAVMHAMKHLRKNGDGRYLAFLFSMIVYCFVIEVPVYFPHWLGLPPDVIFIHNEFSLGFVFNQTPLYIVCLYPALLYSTYVFVDRLGVFKRYPVVVGAICVGFIHSCLYEIFDHFGPQYNWWIWDYNNPVNALLVNSVPLFSIANFSLVPPIAMTLLAHALFFKHQKNASLPNSKLLARSIALGVLTPAVMFVIAPTTIASFITSNATVLTTVGWLTMVAAALVTVIALIGARNHDALAAESNSLSWDNYPFAYFLFYLVVFALLWLFALGDYFAAENGITEFNTYIGSLPYVIACFAFCIFFLYQMRGAQRINP
ncbi:MAG: hypothetical protein KJP25_06790 [Gammaproteobacteria bacterium]|nr:hypothetical protein [Gammaproteobacteria bacterium]MBT8151584.1 hypothetical protein [Gammaproteobacteria bacterium]NND39229.1 hypothetical protein [Pseudomonadales bacterium]RZV49688.1 MAG: hypothetical protein EX270_12280 [Pseudomonadales bacterium]